jgi:hypothetical protein
MAVRRRLAHVRHNPMTDIVRAARHGHRPMFSVTRSRAARGSNPLVGCSSVAGCEGRNDAGLVVASRFRASDPT